MTQVIKVSRPGYNVLTEPNINNYIFDSQYNTFKILKETTASVTYSVNGIYTVAHNLPSYSPTSMLVFMKFPDGYTALLCGFGGTDSRDKSWTISDLFIDSTNISMYIWRNSGTSTILNIKYYIFETPL